MSVPTVALDETSPAGSQAASLGDDRIREHKKQVREMMGVDHDYPSSGQDAGNGQHLQVTLQEQADLGTGAVNATILGSETVGGKGELMYTDEDDTSVQLTSGGKLGSATTALLASTGNFAGIATFQVAPALAAASVDAITEIAAALKSGDDATLITGTAGTADNLAMFNSDGDLVDSTKSTADLANVLGDWLARETATAYEATTDGFVTAYAAYSDEATTQDLYGYTDANADPTGTVVAQQRIYTYETNTDARYSLGITFPVKSGDYWQVAGAATVLWIPLS